ncbi:M23 family metallopeptidase [Paracoccus sp. SCSIO 75233]|uniref:M23 family metallopeptidase n=1 Tax=Paracoccus sp. SCSIO 75233 TaxID=3017782 RepID=UPI0022F03A8A|nr:M23 family metallopeptidase [Paracoccus sp. SCSIO 75233]WBU55344.1 M23 family metallopeptidase [Paracoccus sp. SCSIO 75233]
MDPGEGTRDPFCGLASYDGHGGTDIRLRSLADLDRDVAVIASADGRVANIRDGEPDRLITDAATREAVRGKECGNAVLLDHENGLQTIYCHMKQGSVGVRPGDTVRAGDRLGSVGASGLAQFPHVQLSVRRGGAEIDPLTGRELAQGCDASRDVSGSLFADDIRTPLSNNDVQILDFGLSGEPLDYPRLVIDGAPDIPDASSRGLVGWVWVINFKPGDTIRIRITGPDGSVLSESQSAPEARHKAAYSYYMGKQGTPAPGDYRVDVAIVRGGDELLSGSKTVSVSG